mgnify:FL=1
MNCIRLVEPEIGGGRISKVKIDQIGDSDAQHLEISGLRQDTFEYLVQKYGDQFLEIKFWKCPRIEDLSPLEALSSIRAIHYYWNQKTSRLWNFAKNPNLTVLSFHNFVHLQDLSDLASAKALQILDFGNAASGASYVESLSPIGEIATLKELAFNPKKISDNKAAPLLKLSNLHSLEFSNRLFSSEKIAWLKARLHQGIQSDRLQPYILVDSILNKDCMVTGKGKPFLHSVHDAQKLSRYVQNFERLVDYYRENLHCDEPD